MIYTLIFHEQYSLFYSDSTTTKDRVEGRRTGRNIIPVINGVWVNHIYNYMYLILHNTLSSDSDSTTTIVSGVKGRRTAKNITPVINSV